MYSLYLHIPFCRHRCAYCDFNTYAGQDARIPAYVDALRHEIDLVGQMGTKPEPLSVHTVFFGGGTPSLLAVSQFGSIFESIRGGFALQQDAEITIEANPGTLTSDYVHGLRQAGVNRLSIGVQSSHVDELRMLERNHSFFDVIDSAQRARQAGFDNLSLDLIFGLPEQTLARWQETLRRAVDLAPEHFSLYALTLEHGTPFGHWSERGLIPVPDSDLAADMYEWADDYLSRAGYAQYEISNWALPGRECRHNLQYWRGLDYFGFGAGAHGFVNDMRYANVPGIKAYIARLQGGSSHAEFPTTPACASAHKNTALQSMEEFMLMGLRLTREGVSRRAFRHRFGQEMVETFPEAVHELLRRNLVEWHGDALRLTAQARLLGNQVFLHFLSE